MIFAGIGVGALFAWRTTEGYSDCGSRPVGRPGASVRCATRGLCLTVGCLGLRASVPEGGRRGMGARGFGACWWLALHLEPVVADGVGATSVGMYVIQGGV